MRKTNLIILTILAVMVLTVTAVLAQDKKMDMKPMPKDDMNMGPLGI